MHHILGNECASDAKCAQLFLPFDPCFDVEFTQQSTSENGSPQTMQHLRSSDDEFRGRATRTEWPSVAIGVLILTLFVALTAEHRHLPTAVVVGGFAWTSAWWSSFQHELLHGHPFRNQRLNDAIGRITFDLWLPYTLYKASHLKHHRNELLTDPFEDPESYYRPTSQWSGSTRLFRIFLWINRTLLGRLFLGPWLSVARFLRVESGRVGRGDEDARMVWVAHVAAVAGTGLWVVGVCRVPTWQYLLGASWLATSLILLRSFVEHRWLPDGSSRTAVVLAEWPLALLYLNNNLHHAHHARPSVPWYELPRLAASLDSAEVASASAGCYRGYREVARRFLVRPFCVPVHPSEPLGHSMIVRRVTSTSDS